MGRDEAVTRYIRALDEMAPQWKEEAVVAALENDGADDARAERKREKMSEEERGMAMAMSRPVAVKDEE